MVIYVEHLDKDVVMVVGYDVDEDPGHELCAVYCGEETEQKAHLVARYSRGAGVEARANCEDFKNLDRLTQAVFELTMPKFHDAAMHAFKFTAIDEDLPPTPPQLELPE